MKEINEPVFDLQAVNSSIDLFERKFRMSSAEFFKGYLSNKLPSGLDSLDAFSWAELYKSRLLMEQEAIQHET